MLSSRALTLTAIGTLAGLFSGLFGVGGGTVVVPLLILWLAYGPREATGTSLVAIIVIAAVGAVTQAFYGNLHVLDAVLLGLPAVAGVVFGTWLQQRTSERLLALLFAALLTGTAIALLAQ